MNSFTSTDKKLFFSKNDPNDIRLGDLVSASSTLKKETENTFYIVGYPDDEGIQLNGGRIGAAAAPDKIREYLYKMTPAHTYSPNQTKIYDLGNLNTQTDLGSRHQIAKENAYQVFKAESKLISFGGGHDYGYPDTAAFVSYYKTKNIKPIVLNFDAHLDVRPATNGFNSGTPFYRLLTEFHNDLHFFEIGIQPQCNSLNHRTWATEHGAKIFDLKQIQTENGLDQILESAGFQNAISSFNGMPKTPLFISFDIDCLTSSEAGGCSQSWVTGLNTQSVINFINKLRQKTEICGLGLYEVSPPLDTDNRTSKTAALLAYHSLFAEV